MKINLKKHSSKGLHYQSFFENKNRNIYKTWAGIKKIINVSGKQKQNINVIPNINNIINNPREIAEHLIKHFFQFCKNNRNRSPPTPHPRPRPPSSPQVKIFFNFQNYLKHPIRNTLSINPLKKIK